MEELLEKTANLKRQQDLLKKYKKRYIYLIGEDQDILTKLIYSFHKEKRYQEFTYNKWSKQEYRFKGNEKIIITYLIILNEPLRKVTNKGDGYIFVYNNRNLSSFEKAIEGIEELNKIVMTPPQGKIIFLVGIDDNLRKEEIEVPFSRGKEEADSKKIFYNEISSLNFETINNIVQNMACFFYYYDKKK